MGAILQDAGGSRNAGAAYVFQRDEAGGDNWSEVTKLTASDAQTIDHFGWSVAVSGDTAVRSMTYFREVFAELDLSRLVVPRVQEDLSTRRVLTMDLLDGVPIDYLAAIRELGVDDPEELVRALFRAWMLTAVRLRAFHADIHAGNLILLADGRLGIVDWGIIARLEPETHKMLRSLIEAALGKEEAWDALTAYIIKDPGFDPPRRTGPLR